MRKPIKILNGKIVTPESNVHLQKDYKFIIGIDTGVNTGLAVWIKSEKDFWFLDTVKIHEAIKAVLEWNYMYGPKDSFFRVEDARQRTWIAQEKNLKARVGRAKGAGSVCRDAQIWEDFLTDLGVDFEMVHPKNNKTKMNADAFKKITGYKRQTSQHARDAAALCFGF